MAPACARESQPSVAQQRADWEELNDSLPAEPAIQARMLESYRQRQGFLMWFLPGPDTATTRQLLVDSTHRCGPAIPVFVQRIPLDDPALRTLPAVEVDSTGTVLNRWQIPVGVAIVGVRGDALVTSVGERPADVNFLIRTDGSFTIDTLEYRRAARPVWPQRVCPTEGEFAQLICAEFREGEGGRRRLVLHPPMCGRADSGSSPVSPTVRDSAPARPSQDW